MEEKNLERDRAAKDTYDDYAGTFSPIWNSVGARTLLLKGWPSAKSNGQINTWVDNPRHGSARKGRLPWDDVCAPWAT